MDKDMFGPPLREQAAAVQLGDIDIATLQQGHNVTVVPMLEGRILADTSWAVPDEWWVTSLHLTETYPPPEKYWMLRVVGRFAYAPDDPEGNVLASMVDVCTPEHISINFLGRGFTNPATYTRNVSERGAV